MGVHSSNFGTQNTKGVCVCVCVVRARDDFFARLAAPAEGGGVGAGNLTSNFDILTTRRQTHALDSTGLHVCVRYIIMEREEGYFIALSLSGLFILSYADVLYSLVLQPPPRPSKIDAGEIMTDRR